MRLLCAVQCVREQVRRCDGVPVLLSHLHADHVKLLWSTVWVLVQLCQDPDTSAEIRAWGGVQQLLRILHGCVSMQCCFKDLRTSSHKPFLLSRERVYVTDRSTIDALSSANAAGRIHRQHVSTEIGAQETTENIMNLQAGEDRCSSLGKILL